MIVPGLCLGFYSVPFPDDQPEKEAPVNRSRLILEYILDRRAGVLDEYSVPATTTYLTLPAARHGREGGDGLQECAIPRLLHSMHLSPMTLVSSSRLHLRAA